MVKHDAAGSGIVRDGALLVLQIGCQIERLFSSLLLTACAAGELQLDMELLEQSREDEGLEKWEEEGLHEV